MRARAALGCGLLCAVLGAVDAAGSDGLAIDGTDSARLRPPPGVVIAPYVNAGYRLTLDQGVARVETSAAPLGSHVPFTLPERQPGAAGTPRQALARALATGARTRYQVVSRVLGWVSRNIAYELERRLPQDADAVLHRRSGYCTGVARLTVGLLDELGIEAREVPGFVVGDPDSPGQGFHRWVEVYYPDRGWVFSDPLVSHQVVAATYLRLASESVVAGRADESSLLGRDDETVAVDLFPGVAPGIRVRRNEDRQLAGALRVVVGGEPAGMAVLEGQGVRLTHALAAGVSTFLGLQPGLYNLQLLLTGGPRLERQIDLPGRVRQAVLVPLGPEDGPGVAGGAGR